MARRDYRSIAGKHARARLVGAAALLAAALSGCAVAPAEGEREAASAVRDEVTSMASEPDASGVRTWWLFEGGRGATVRARGLDEALRLGGFAPRRGEGGDGSYVSRAEGDGVEPVSEPRALIPISGGGR